MTQTMDLVAESRPRLRGTERRWPPLYNPPGRNSLHFRIGDHGEFFAQMEQRLLQHFPDLFRSRSGDLDATWFRPGVDARDSRRLLREVQSAVPLHSMLEVWAEILDILSFYQERYLQEGFVRTAVEPRSVTELWRMVGYAGSPPLAGTAQVAVFLDPIEGLPATLELPPGLEVRGVPREGDDPLVFETFEWASFEVSKNQRVLEGFEAMVRAQPLIVSGPAAKDIESLWLEGQPTAGDFLLLLGPAAKGGGRSLGFRQILEAEASETYPSYTRVRWQGPLTDGRPDEGTPGPASERLEVHQAMVQRRMVSLFGAEAPYFRELTVEEQRQYWPIAGGVQLLEASGSRSVNGRGSRVLPEADVRDLVWAGEALLVATAEGLMRSRDGGITWRPVGLSLAMGAVRCLAALGSMVFAGADDGRVFRSRDGGTSWDTLGVQGVPLMGRLRFRSPVVGTLDGKIPYTLMLRRRGAHLVIVAGTSEGVFWTHEAAIGWRSMSRGLPGFDAETGSAAVAVYDVIPGPRGGQLLAATSSGIYRWRPSRKRWRPCNVGLPCTDPITGASRTETFALEAMPGRFVVGSQEGVFRSGPAARRWEPVLLDAAAPWGTAVRHLARGGARGFETLLAGTDLGLFESLNQGDSWSSRPLNEGSEGPVVALTGGETPALATPWGEVTHDEWPGFRLHDGQIDLAEVVGDLLPRGWVVLHQDDATGPLVEVLEIQEAFEVDRREFDLEARVTRLRVDPAVDLARFDLRRATAWVASEPFVLGDLRRHTWKERADGLAKTLEAWGERPVLVEPRHPLAALLLFSHVLSQPSKAPESGWEGLVDEVEGWRSTAPWRQVKKASWIAQRLRRAESCYGRLCSLAPWPVHLVRRLVEALGLPFEEGAGQYRWDLEALVDPEGEPCLRLFGNTAVLVEGATHRDEVIGSAKADQAFQRFALPSPLAWRQVEGFLRPELRVQVHGEAWLPVRSFEGQGPEDRVFLLRRNVDGVDEIVFGDGLCGALPAAGHDNVVATYRSGVTGQAVVSGALNEVPSRPLGLAELFNPHAGRQGRPADRPHDDPRAGASRTRSCNRIVSLTDFGDYLAEQPGVVRSTVRVQGEGDAVSAVHLWVGFEETFSAVPDPHRVADRLERLRRRIRAHQHVRVPFQLREIDSRPVELTARVFGAWDPDRDLVDLEGLIWQALEKRFGLRWHAIGKQLTQAEVMRVLRLPEGVQGIQRVKIDMPESAPTVGVEPQSVPLFWLRRESSRIELMPTNSLSNRFGEAP